MMRPRPAQIYGVALALESDEALNPVDAGVLGPDAFARQILFRMWVKSRRESGSVKIPATDFALIAEAMGCSSLLEKAL